MIYVTVWCSNSNRARSLYLHVSTDAEVPDASIRRGRLPFEIHEGVCRDMQLAPEDWVLVHLIHPLRHDADRGDVVVVVYRNRDDDFMVYNCRRP
jgi:hypothetical protein